jgi:hypothetical protein
MEYEPLYGKQVTLMIEVIRLDHGVAEWNANTRECQFASEKLPKRRTNRQFCEYF